MFVGCVPEEESNGGGNSSDIKRSAKRVVEVKTPIEFVVTNNKSRNIYRQIAITPQKFGEGKREEHKGQKKHRIERSVALDVDTVYCQDR